MESLIFPTVHDGVVIEKLHPANVLNSRGLRTFEMCVPGTAQCTTYFRNAGEDFGGHFHKGDDPSKDPEIFQLIFGKLAFSFKDKHGGEIFYELDVTDGVPMLMYIHPYILHYARAITDVIFMEFRKTPFDHKHPDTYPPEEF